MRSLFLCLGLLARTLSADEIDTYVQAQLSANHIPSLALAVVRNGQPVKMQGYGLADVENQVAATPHTVYLLASVTKQFTATAVMMLAQESKLKLDDSIAQYLDGAPEAWRPITIRNLLTHTGGFPHTISSAGSPGWFVTDHSSKDVIQIAAASPLLFQHSEKFSYSNVGFMLLGYIIEKAGGKPYWEFLHERIFQPLGMTSTRNSDPRVVIPYRAGAYGWQGNQFVNRLHPYPSSGFSAGCLMSTAEDMAKWDAALYTEKLLPQSALKQMWTSGKLASGADTGYGFGWTLSDYYGHRIIAHSGSFQGASTHITRFVDDRLTVIVLINRDQADASGIANHIAAAYLPNLSTKTGPDPDPARTARLKKLLADIANGPSNSDASPELTDGAKVYLKSGVPWVTHAAALLKTPDEFSFLRCDPPPEPGAERNGSPVDRLCYYRLGFRGRSVDWSFYLTADGKVAGLQPQR